MAQLVREIMTTDPVSMQIDTPVRLAAQEMRDRGIGNVLVLDGDRLCGIVTDRDIAVRAVAQRDDLSTCYLRDICSENMVTVRPDEEVDNAIARMHEHALRRVPVVSEGRPVGMLSIGDAAVDRDPDSALGHISAARPNI